MPVIVIDKIKAATTGFKLIDAVDVNGQITGWQNPVKNIFGTVAEITGVALGDTFIVRDASSEWPQFAGVDIYGNAATKTNNAIYIIGDSIPNGEPLPVLMVTAPAVGMILLATSELKNYVSPGEWANLILAGSGAIVGQSLRHAEELNVVIGTNYDASTKQLSINETLQANDNVNMYVNGLKYSHLGTTKAFSFTENTTYLVWIPDNAGFDLHENDYIEIEIFNNEN